MSADPTVVVPALLSAAGLQPSTEEVAVMIAEYPARAEQIEALWAVEAARYEEPCVIFRALP
ncbi:MAG: hypothetical protein J0I34_19465 [Pseudonocardia sp.]|uniref:hypothetical protein n=1 Tax=unclassified Pseudonocardia TaxID=2619320 RepID=UPI00086AC4A6|nr:MULTISPECIES: hypothetical protein [unclassified Pseudonocardia]MBN9110947.1 hypothetical protein [Pseudonocardia sp.]ODU25043.1 MAG: hypothetical protein ABS80_10880 [Pseudonocardia sp. SCN 72-51]ODV05001.1 MAG: hypothetical protein ABT15_18570 [Pseudonocardia sp. SCN 73-27]